MIHYHIVQEVQPANPGTKRGWIRFHRHAGLPLLLVGFLTVGLFASGNARAVELSERLLPDTTQGVVTITNGKALAEHWEQTQLAELLNDPVMEPFRNDIERQFNEEWTRTRERLGLTLDDIRGVPSGETSIAMVRTPKGTAAVALIMDVAGREQQASDFLAKVSAQLIKDGAKASTAMVRGATVQVFELPKPAADSPLQLAADVQRFAYYFHVDDVVVAADQPEVIDQVLARMQGESGKSLVDNPAYQSVMARCAQELPEGRVPQIRWFIRPLDYAKTVRDSLSAADREASARTFEILQNQGFFAVQGAGGFLDFAVDGLEMVGVAYIYAPKPWEKAMNMLVLPNRADFAPKSWVPRNAAKYTVIHADPTAIFDNVGTLVDEIIGEHGEGAWDEIIKGLEEDEYGPQINLKSELIDQLTGRLDLVLDYERPITPQSERMVIALETKDQKAVDQAVEKLLKEDKETVERLSFEGHIIWKTADTALRNLQKQDRQNESDTYSELGLEGFGPVVPEDEPEEETVEPLFPDAAVCVANGTLYLASELDFLLEILKSKADDRDMLTGAIDYQVVQDAMSNLGCEDSFFRLFARTDESYRPTYEMIRLGKMTESDMLLERLLELIFPPEAEDGVRKPRIDGSKLPEFETVRRHFGPAGTFGVSEDDGWFFKTFLLSK